MSVLYGSLGFKGGDSSIVKELYEGCLGYSHDENTVISPLSGFFLGAMYRNTTNESQFQISPFEYKEWVVSSYSRLDNRLFLFKELDIPNEDQGIISDNYLIALAFEKWGDNIVYNLKGDWVISVWDSDKKEFFLAKDFHGSTGVFYTFINHEFVYCSSLKGILNVSDFQKKTNYNYFANFITQSNLKLGETPFEGVFFLPPCHHLRINSKESTLRKYWSVSELKSIRYSKKEEYYESFLETYKKAVYNRLRYGGEIGSTLSGGLDSGSVSVLAAKFLLKENKELYSFSSVSEYVSNDNLLGLKNKFVNEKELAELTSKKVGNIKWFPVFGNDISVLKGIKIATKIGSSPVYAPSNAHWFYEIFTSAVEKNVKVILNGQEGNNTVSWAGPDGYNNSISKKFKTLFLDIFPFLEGIKTREEIKKELSDVLQDKFITQNSILYKINDTVLEWARLRKMSGIESRAYLMSLTTSSSGIVWQNSALNYNIETPDPTADEDVIKYCLGVPDEVYSSKEYNRFLLRKSFKNILPDEVLFNRQTGLQGIDNWYRIKRDYLEIEFFIDNANDQFYEIYKKDTLKQYLNLIVNDNTGKAYLKYGPQLLLSLAIGIFFEEFS